MYALIPIFCQQSIVAPSSGSAYDYITGTPDLADDFETLTNGTAVNGRTLPTGGGTWTADAALVGDGDGTDAGVKVSSGTSALLAMKRLIGSDDFKIRAIWHPGASGDNRMTLFGRDGQSTAFQRYGYLLYIVPSSSQVQIYESDDYSVTALATENSVSLPREDLAIEFRCVGSTLTGYVNGTQVITASNSKWTTGNRGGHGVYQRTNNDQRLKYIDIVWL